MSFSISSKLCELLSRAENPALKESSWLSSVWDFCDYKIHASGVQDGHVGKSWTNLHPRRQQICDPVQFSSVTQSCLTICNPMNCSMPATLSITHSRNPPKPMSIESMMPYNHLILYRPLLLLPSIFLSIKVFSNESLVDIKKGHVKLNINS